MDSVTFVLCTYKDTELLHDCLFRLRCYYPTERVIVISDGDADPVIAALCARYKVDLYPTTTTRDYYQVPTTNDPSTYIGMQLNDREQSGLWWQRLLWAYLQAPTDYLIKIDTDTSVHRRLDLSTLNSDTDMAGTLQNITVYGVPMQSVQGGCILLKRSMAERLYREIDFRSYCCYVGGPSKVFQPEYLHYGEDKAVTRMVGSLGGIIQDWSQVSCYHKMPKIHAGNFAITHPSIMKMRVNP